MIHTKCTISRVFLLAAGLCFSLSAQPESMQGNRRGRSEGFYRCENANTTGKGSIWGSVQTTGFLWDDAQDGQISIVPFLDAGISAGILPFLSSSVRARLVSYFYDDRPQIGDLNIGIKATTPDNKDLRYNAVALSVRYVHSFLSNFKSIGGLRNDQGYGFSPEGFLLGGNSLVLRFAFERDYIARNSRLPLKLLANVGTKISLNSDFFKYSQYSVDLGFGYVGRMADFFIAYSLDGFYNSSLGPKKVAFKLAPDNKTRVWEVAFPENPMYVIFGGRLRYGNGVTLSGFVPLLLSSNVGSSRAQSEIIEFRQQVVNPDPSYEYYEEVQRGVNEPFDPWYAKWKIIAEVSFPIIYRQTASEMKRSFLLLKNRGNGRRIDIDEKLQQIRKESGDQVGEDAQLDPEEEKRRRLEEIRKRREEIENQ